MKILILGALFLLGSCHDENLLRNFETRGSIIQGQSDEIEGLTKSLARQEKELDDLSKKIEPVEDARVKGCNDFKKYLTLQGETLKDDSWKFCAGIEKEVADAREKRQEEEFKRNWKRGAEAFFRGSEFNGHCYSIKDGSRVDC